MDEEKLIKLALLGVGGYFLYMWYQQHYGTTGVATTTTNTGTTTTTNTGTQTTTNTGTPAATTVSSATLNALATSLIGAALIAPTTQLNVDEWNYYLTHLYPSATVLDPIQAGLTRDANGGLPRNMTAMQYVTARAAVGLPVNASGGGLTGWGGFGGWNPGQGGWTN